MPPVMFLDESGDHSLSKIDPQYPVFVLCGVIMDEEHHKDVAAPALARFKKTLFGRDDLVLHTLEFTRNQAGFEVMKDHGFRVRFFRGLEELFNSLEFKIVACVVKKVEHLNRYGLSAVDPYMLSLSVLVERFVFECGSAGGSIVAEGRGQNLDNALELAFLDLKIRGTGYIPPTKIRKRIHNFAIHDKRENLAGLQMADIAATPIGRHVVGKKTYAGYSSEGDFFRIVERRFRKDWKSNYQGMGLVVLPK